MFSYSVLLKESEDPFRVSAVNKRMVARGGGGGTPYSEPPVDCSQPSIFSYFYSIDERADRIVRKVDASSKRKT